MFANKLIENISDPGNAKDHYQWFIKNKNTKSVKPSKIITYKPKAFENSNIVGIKSVITEYLKTLYKLSKTGKVGSNSCLYDDTKKSKIYLSKKKRSKNNKTWLWF